MSRVVALSGGVGGAKLAAGLAAVVADEELLVAVNTGDDFEHLGLTICPDIDSNLYALAGLNDVARGWGRRDESWNFMQALAQLRGEDWFQLGDRDLATHVLRSQRLRQGASLSAVTTELARALGIAARVLPMSDDPVRTIVDTEAGRLCFQDYFVRRRCEPRVRGFDYEGAGRARAHPDLLAALRDPALEAVVICPSNPWLSVGPMLAMPALRDALAHCAAPVVAVSPIVGGRALKGPADKLMRELGLKPGTAAIAAHYQGLVDGLLIDETDRADLAALAHCGCAVRCAPTVMSDAGARMALAHEALRFAASLRGTAGKA
ncbi:MAG: 2-phospho-L-lactate transferase [Nevskia sp.]|nr:2-phospho-L-lactate transferase [Nevskia sp.]